MVGKYIKIHIYILKYFLDNYYSLFIIDIIKNYIDDVSQIQTENNYLVDLNDTMFNTTEFDQRSYFVDTQNQIAGNVK